MSSAEALKNDGHSEGTPTSPGTKRPAEPLFVEQNEEIEADGAHSNKKSKQDHDSAFSSQDARIKPIFTPEKIAAYEALKTEGFPRIAIYHKSFPKIETGVTETNHRFIKAYDEKKKNGFENAQIDKIVTGDLQKYRSPHAVYPGVKPVALLGAAGVGKSSFVNSCLDQQNAAVESDSGTRGTSVVHEYSAARPDQSEKYHVVLRYLQTRQVDMRVRKHYREIIEYRTADTEDLEDEDEIREQTKDLKMKHDTAIDFFLTLLRDREDFRTREKVEEFFEEREGDREEEVVSELNGLIDELLEAKQIRKNHNVEAFTAETEEELSVIFQKISGASGVEPRVWPLLHKVQVHDDTYLLNSGVVIGDAPGMTDTNQTVVQNTRSYLETAGTIFVFARPSRITQNPDLDTNLLECIRCNKRAETRLIVTNIDEKKKFKPAELAELAPEEKDILHAAEDRVSRLKEEQARLREAKESATSFEGLKAFDQQVREAEIELKNAEMSVKQVTIEIHCRGLEKKLVGKFRELQGSKKAPDLKVMFVSNSEYQKHLAGYDAKDPPILDVEATGIPAVKRVLFKVPAREKLPKLSFMVRKRLPSAYTGIMGILTKSPLERKQDVEKLIVKVFSEEETTLLEQIEEKLRLNFAERILHTFRSNQPRWQRLAEAKLNEWKNFNPGTFAAFCRKDGDWRVPAPKGASKDNQKKYNWNLEIQSLFAGKLNGSFDSLLDDVDSIENETITKVSSLYQRILDELEACEAFQGADEKAFFQHIRDVKDEIVSELSHDFNAFKSQVDMIRNATTGRGDETYIASIMHEVYQECVKMSSESYQRRALPAVEFINKRGEVKKRTGPHPARVEEIRKKLAGEGTVQSVFDSVSKEASDGFEGLLKASRGKWEVRIKTGSESVIEDFKSRFDTTEIKSEEGEEFNQSLIEEAHAAMTSLADMAEELKECEEYEKSGGPQN